MFYTMTLPVTSLCCLLKTNRKISVTCHLFDYCVTIFEILNQITLGYSWILDIFQIVYVYSLINTCFLKAPWQSLASPLLCSDDACAPRNTVAVATCSLTILCFYCPVAYSTLPCLAEPDEHFLFRSDQQHLGALNQLIFDLKLKVYSHHSI